MTIEPGWSIVTSSFDPGTTPPLQLPPTLHEPPAALIQEIGASNARSSRCSKNFNRLPLNRHGLAILLLFRVHVRRSNSYALANDIKLPKLRVLKFAKFVHVRIRAAFRINMVLGSRSLG